MQGLVADRLKDVHVSPEGDRVRIIFSQQGADWYFEAEMGDFRALLPILIQKTNPLGREVTTLQVTHVDAWETIEREFLLTLTNSVGAQTTYGLPQPLVQKLHVLTGENLDPERSPTTH